MHTGARARKQKYISIYISLYMKTFLKTGVYIYIIDIFFWFFYALPITGLILIACVSDNNIATSAIALAFTDNSLVNEQ